MSISLLARATSVAFLAFPLGAAAQTLGDSAEEAGATHGPVLAMVDAPPETSAPRMLNPKQLAVGARARYPGWIDWRSQRAEAELLIAIDARGWVREVEVVHSSGNRLVDRALREAAHGLRFEPAVTGKEPVAAWVKLPVLVGGR